MEKILEFTVREQTIQKKDFFEKLHAGTKGYLKCHFDFLDPWDGLKKMAVYRYGVKEEFADYLDGNDQCPVPDAAAACDKFTVAVCGVKDGFKIMTGETTVYLDY